MTVNGSIAGTSTAFTMDGPGALVLNGSSFPVNNGTGGTIVVSNPNGVLTVTGTITGSGTAFTMAGPGTLAFASNNTLSSGTTNVTGGTLQYFGVQSVSAIKTLNMRGAVVTSFGQLNTDVATSYNKGTSSTNILGGGTLVLAATAASRRPRTSISAPTPAPTPTGDRGSMSPRSISAAASAISTAPAATTPWRNISATATQ